MHLIIKMILWFFLSFHAVWCLECFLYALSLFINSIVLKTNDIPVKNILMRDSRKEKLFLYDIGIWPSEQGYVERNKCVLVFLCLFLLVREVEIKWILERSKWKHWGGYTGTLCWEYLMEFFRPLVEGIILLHVRSKLAWRHYLCESTTLPYHYRGYKSTARASWYFDVDSCSHDVVKLCIASIKKKSNAIAFV